MTEEFILILTISQKNDLNFCYFNDEYRKENAKKNKE